MKNNIQEILKEIYDIDPTLKGREEELTNALEKMLKMKPVSKIDENFKNDLRQRLYVEAKYWSRKKFNFQSFIQVLTSFALWGAIAWISAFVILDSSTLNIDKTLPPVNNGDWANILMMTSDAPENKRLSHQDDKVRWIKDEWLLKSSMPEMAKEEVPAFEDADIENFAVKSMPKWVVSSDDEIAEAPVKALMESDEAIDFDETKKEETVWWADKYLFWENFAEVDNADFNENKDGQKIDIEQRDISWKPPQLYKYSFSGEFPDLKKQYKYYIVTTLNRGVTTVEEITADSKNEKAITSELDIDRMIRSSVHPDSDAYKEITYKDVEFTYIRKYKMKSEYLIPALWFKWSRHPVKWEWFKLDQFIPLVNINNK